MSRVVTVYQLKSKLIASAVLWNTKKNINWNASKKITIGRQGWYPVKRVQRLFSRSIFDQPKYMVLYDPTKHHRWTYESHPQKSRKSYAPS